MQEVQPHRLTDAELVRYAYLQGAQNLTAAWIDELIKRLEARLDDNR